MISVVQMQQELEPLSYRTPVPSFSHQASHGMMSFCCSYP